MKYPDRTITQIMHHPYYNNVSNLSISDQLQNIEIEQLKKMIVDKMKNSIAEQLNI